MRGALEETFLQEKRMRGRQPKHTHTHTHISIYKLFMSYKPQRV